MPREYNNLVNFWNAYQGSKVEINSLSKDNYSATGKKWKARNFEQINRELDNIGDGLSRVVTAQIN